MISGLMARIGKQCNVWSVVMWLIAVADVGGRI
jgi:hypothetical protein